MAKTKHDPARSTKPGYPAHPFPSKLTETVKDNIERNRRELASEEPRLSSKPVVAWLAFTGKCNLACSHCIRTLETRGQGDDMSEYVFDKLCSQLFPYVERIWLGGNNIGEQLLAKNWDSMIERLSEFPLILDLITNGTALSERRIRQLISIHATIAISLEGIRPETYQASRGQSVDKLLGRVELIAQERARHQDNKSRIHFGYTTYYDNIRELPELVRRAGDLGVDRIEVHHLFPLFEHQRHQSLVYHRALANDMFEEAENLANSAGMELRLPPRFEITPINGDPASTPEGEPSCPLPWIATSITEHGDVAPCCGASEEFLGNLRDQDFDDIWNGRRYQDLRRTVNSDNPWPVCAVCPSVWRGLNHKDENILRGIGLAAQQQPPLTHLKEFAKSALKTNKLGRRALKAYRQIRGSHPH